MKKIILLLPLLLLVSCSKTVVFTKSFTEFSDNRWNKADEKVFQFKIKKDISSGEITLHFGHTPDPQYQSLPLEVSVKYPDGKIDNVFLNLQFDKDNGHSMSECTDDKCEVQTNIKEGVAIPAGDYTVSVKNAAMEDYTPNVLSVGISVKQDE